MAVLSRTVRFAINTHATPTIPLSAHTPVSPYKERNSYAGNPSLRGLGRHYELRVDCAGEPDPLTGYLIDIKTIDRAVREHAVPIIADAAHAEASGNAARTVDPMALLPAIIRALAAALPVPLRGVTWFLSPYYHIEMRTQDQTIVLLRQKFDFAASHRLHVPALSPEENRARFGKCNNPGGHGHNYQVEPCVAVPIASGTPAFVLQDLERLTDETVIERFDHKNLNTDTAEFRDGSGLNPSVENIARVCFDLLKAPIAASGSGATLRSVTVWETEKTCCTYPAV